jgi:CheY-like chemotaxis protein
MDSFVTPDSDSTALEASSAWASACLIALLERHGVPPRHQAAVIADICGISISQARRKLRGSVWLFGEVLALCRHHGESLDAVFAASVMVPGSAPGSLTGTPHTSLPATLLIDDQRLACDILLGPKVAPGGAAYHEGLLALHDPQAGWLAGIATHLKALTPDHAAAPRFKVDQICLRQETDAPRARIAVLDDDACSAAALTDWFNEVGFEAQAYHSPEQLLAHPLSDHDAFVVDLILAGGQTSEALVERIRREQPDAPVILLTGQLREGLASEATLATMLRTQGVTFFEKPVRPAVLTAAIQNSLDRQHRHGDA